MSSQSDPSTRIIVKSDRSGRTRYTAQYKQDVLAAFESSSLSTPDFAKQCGIKYDGLRAYQTFIYRHQDLDSKRSTQPHYAAAVGWP